jgi:hypothetical protein
MEEKRGVYRGFIGKPEGNNPLGRLGHRWEDHSKTDLKEMGCEGLGFIELS